MAKKLLNWNFSNATASINIGANTNPATIKKNDTIYYSDRHPLKQVGALMVVDFSAFYPREDVVIYLKRIGTALKYSGYGDRVISPAEIGVGVPLYHNGDPTQSYILYKYTLENGTKYPVLYFHEVDTGYEAPLFLNTANTDSDFSGFCGQLYDDGTFTGDRVNIVGVDINQYNPNKVYGYWYRKSYDNVQIINQRAINLFSIDYEPEGEFVPEGVGDFNSRSDDINLPDLPTLSAIDTRMLRVYRMTSENLSKFNKFLWSDLFDVNTFKKLFTDPMQAVLNLNISPINVDVLGPSEIKLGNINTGVQGEMCQQQYQKIDFGTIRLNEYWASFADYSPYTRLSIYLPYVGVQSLSIDDVMNGTIQLVGYCDVLTGSILYVLKSNQVNRAGHSHNSVLYSWGGNCQYQIPLTANNMSSVISSITGTAGSVLGAIGATVATGGLTAPIAVGAIGSAVTNTLNAKTQIQRGGGVGGATGMFGVQRPYLILERPEQRTIQDFGGQIGNPADVTDYLGNFSGFVKVKAVHVENIAGATEAEQTEIERLLKDGVII